MPALVLPQPPVPEWMLCRRIKEIELTKLTLKPDHRITYVTEEDFTTAPCAQITRHEHT